MIIIRSYKVTYAVHTFPDEPWTPPQPFVYMMQNIGWLLHFNFSERVPLIILHVHICFYIETKTLNNVYVLCICSCFLLLKNIILNNIYDDDNNNNNNHEWDVYRHIFSHLLHNAYCVFIHKLILNSIQCMSMLCLHGDLARESEGGRCRASIWFLALGSSFSLV